MTVTRPGGDPDPGETGRFQATVHASDDQVRQRLDLLVAAALPDGTRGEAQRLIAMPEESEAGVRVNGRRAVPGYRVRPGDRITIERPDPRPSAIQPESIPLRIVYEDSDVLVIDKPRGMVVHPAPGALHGTLVHAVLACVDDLSGVGGEERPGIVHRLDKDTGGLMVVAKNDRAHLALQAQIQARTAERRYLALVWGQPRFQEAEVNAPIGRHPVDRKKMAVITDPRYTSRSARTDLIVRERYAGVFALLEARLYTGRTHQIRVHCAYIHHPVVGDPVYGGERALPGGVFSTVQMAALRAAVADLHGQALHAFALGFDHPVTGERLHFTVPLPAPIQNVLGCLSSAG